MTTNLFKHLNIRIITCIAIPLLLSSCFTGVESTNKINLSRQDRKIISASPEDLFLNDIKGTPLSRWNKGKEFIAADNRTALVFIQEGMPVNPDELSLQGKTLAFQGVSSMVAPDGSTKAIIIFSDGNSLYKYDTGKTPDAAAAILSSDLPMIIDREMVNKTDSLMRGRTLWTRSPLWYDKDGSRLKGAKFVPVTISAVEVGNVVFPVRVFFNDSEGKSASMWMNLGSTSADSRAFADIFSLSDPRLKYADIPEESWRLIQHGRVRKGMTKEECRLALGAPSDVASGHDWSQTLDIWRYDNGDYVYLRFEDGMLIDIRR